MQKGPGTLRGHPAPSSGCGRGQLALRLTAPSVPFSPSGPPKASTMPSPAIPVAAIAAKTETPIATIPPANFAKPFNMTTSCRLPGGDVFLAEKQKNPPWEPFPGGLWTQLDRLRSTLIMARSLHFGYLKLQNFKEARISLSSTPTRRVRQVRSDGFSAIFLELRNVERP